MAHYLPEIISNLRTCNDMLLGMMEDAYNNKQKHRPFYRNRKNTRKNPPKIFTSARKNNDCENFIEATHW